MNNTHSRASVYDNDIQYTSIRNIFSTQYKYETGDTVIPSWLNVDAAAVVNVDCSYTHKRQSKYSI